MLQRAKITDTQNKEQFFRIKQQEPLKKDGATSMIKIEDDHWRNTWSFDDPDTKGQSFVDFNTNKIEKTRLETINN